MFLYNWTKIFEAAKGNVGDMVRIFKMMAHNHIPINYKDKTYKFSHINFKGSSFLAHADVLALESSKYSNVDISQYLALASFRSYPEYLINGTTTLEVVTIPINPQLYVNNRLLQLDENGLLHFKFEEVPQEKH